MKNKIIKTIRLIGVYTVAVVILLTMVSTMVFANQEDILGLGGYLKCASNKMLTLYYMKKTGDIAVKNNATSAVWYSALPKEEYPENANQAFIKEFKSLFIFTYTHLNLVTNKDVTVSLADIDYTVEAISINNGISLTFDFEELFLKFTIEFILKQDSLVVKVPNDKIIEGFGVEANLEKIKDDIQKGIKYLHDILNEILKDITGEAEIENLNKEIVSDLNSLDTKVDEVKDAIGLEVSSDAMQRQMASITQKFEDQTGIYNLIRTNSNVGKTVKDKYAQNRSDVSFQLAILRNLISEFKVFDIAGLVSISILPYFGAAGDNNDGYVFYPDGSGAITYFKKDHPNYTFSYEANVYSDDTPDLDWEDAKSNAGLRSTCLPVFGIQKNGSAFIADMERGDAGCKVIYSPSGLSVNVHRVYYSLLYRRKMVRDKEAGSLSQASDAYEQQRQKSDYQIRYMFLNKENSDYNGMANRLRKQMIDDGRLIKSKTIKEELPVALELLGGVRQKVLFYQELIDMTSYKQAQEILLELGGFSDTRLLVNYKGWNKEGLDVFPTTLNTSKKLGGDEEFNIFLKTAADLNAMVFLENNILEAQAGEKGFNYGELALSYNLRPIVSTTSIPEKWLISPPIAEKKINKLVQEIKELGTANLSFDRLGSMLYFDYSLSDKQKSTRNQTMSIWKNILKNAQDSIGAVAVNEGNSYTFSSSDWIIKAPVGSSEYIFTHQSIPFYQMVIHGSINYSLKPFNSFYDFQYEKMKTIEYGGIPYYALTYEDPTKLGDLEINMLTGTFNDFKDEIKNTIEEFANNFGRLSSYHIISHSRPIDGLAVLEYQDGTIVYINYNSDKIKYQQHEIPAMDYIVTGEKRSVKYEQKVSYYEAERRLGWLPICGALGIGIFGVFCISFIVFRYTRFRKSKKRGSNQV